MSRRVHSIKAGLAWCHLIEGDTGLVLVDTGSRGHTDDIVSRVRSLGKPLRLVFVTHAHLDHYGSAAGVRNATGAPVAVHRADADAMAHGESHLGSVRLWGHVVKRLLPWIERVVGPEPISADIVVEDGDDLSAYGIPARVVHAPGHTPGSCALLVDESLAFVGDLVSPMLFPHPQMIYATDWQRLAQSLRSMQELSPTLVYSGHGGSAMSGETFRRIRMRERR